MAWKLGANGDGLAAEAEKALLDGFRALLASVEGTVASHFHSESTNAVDPVHVPAPEAAPEPESAPEPAAEPPQPA